jgi:hypothetical protein
MYPTLMMLPQPANASAVRQQDRPGRGRAIVACDSGREGMWQGDRQPV